MNEPLKNLCIRTLVRSLVFRAALGLTAVAASGCAARPARVAQGETVSTGDTLYDDFFGAVREARQSGISAKADELAAHAPLLKVLGLSASAPPLQAVEEIGLRAKQLQDRGVLLHLEITPDPKFVAARPKGDRADLAADDAALVKALEDGVRSALDLRRKLGAVAVRAEALQKKREDLRSKVDTTFGGDKQGRREEILLELDASQLVLGEAAEKANQGAAAAARFALELALAVETGAIAAIEAKAAKGAKKPLVLAPVPPPVVSAPPPPPPPPAAPPKAGPVRRTAPAAAPAAAAPPPKKKGTKGGDDFEP